MKEQKSPLVFTLVIWIVWGVITLGGIMLQTGEDTSLDELVTSGPVYGVIAAAIFVVAVVAVRKWWRETGVKGPDDTRHLRYVIFPSVLILLMLIAGLTGGVATDILLIVLLNTIFVGISEELANRGILLYGFLSKYGIWSSVIVVSILFGGIHALNGLITGDFGQSIPQAIFATASGFWYAALRLRSTTIIPAMILHTLWDFSIFLILTGIQEGTTNPLFGAVQFVFLPILVIYGIWMLRGYKKEVMEPVTA